MSTSGQITASFYYLDKNSAPDITNLDAQSANDLAHDRKPIEAVWIMPSGQINLFKNPEQKFLSRHVPHLSSRFLKT